jgi:hypothetical protein
MAKEGLPSEPQDGGSELGGAIAHGIQPSPKADATRLSTGSVLRPRNELNPVPA